MSTFQNGFKKMHVKHGLLIEETPNFTQLSTEIWTVQVEIHSYPEVKPDHHTVTNIGICYYTFTYANSIIMHSNTISFVITNIWTTLDYFETSNTWERDKSCTKLKPFYNLFSLNNCLTLILSDVWRFRLNAGFFVYSWYGFPRR